MYIQKRFIIIDKYRVLISILSYKVNVVESLIKGDQLMTIYWERCDLCGQHRPVKKCSLMPEISIDVHCCIACPYWMNKCTTPAWKIEEYRLQPTPRRSLSSEDKEKLIKELTSLLKGS